MIWNASSASIEIIMFLFVNLLMRCITFIVLYIMNHACIPGINPTWSRGLIFLMCCCFCVGSILLRTFVSVFIRDNSPQCSFLIVSSSLELRRCCLYINDIVYFKVTVGPNLFLSLNLYKCPVYRLKGNNELTRVFLSQCSKATKVK